MLYPLNILKNNFTKMTAKIIASIYFPEFILRSTLIIRQSIWSQTKSALLRSFPVLVVLSRACLNGVCYGVINGLQNSS